MPSGEETYRETMRGIRLYMGWSDIPDLDSTNTASDNNPFSGPKAATPGKVSVQMPTDDWLCKKIAKLNLTLVEGYPSRSSEASGLLMDQFLRTAKSQSKWYRLSSDHKADPATVSNWSAESSKLNSCYNRIARQSGLISPPPPPPPLHPDIFHKRLCEDGRSQLERLQSFITRLPALTGVFSNCSKTCRASFEPYVLTVKERVPQRVQVPWMNYSIAWTLIPLCKRLPKPWKT